MRRGHLTGTAGAHLDNRANDADCSARLWSRSQTPANFRAAWTAALPAAT